MKPATQRALFGTDYIRLWRLAFPEQARGHYQRYDRSERGRARNLRYEGTQGANVADRRYRLTGKAAANSRRFYRTEKGRAASLEKDARRRARHRFALVLGAESAIKAIYDRAAWLRSQGWDVAVDHIFPLGFGWHEPSNLQIIFTSENSRKSCNPDFIPSVIFS